MYDAKEPGKIINEFLVTLFVPSIFVFILLFSIFRLYLDSFLLDMGLDRIVPQSGAGAISAGYGRFLLLIVSTAVILLPYIWVYREFARERLRERGYV